MKASNTILLHDISCKLCKPAILAIRRTQRAKRGPRGFLPEITVTLIPDLNVFGKFSGFHVGLVKEEKSS